MIKKLAGRSEFSRNVLTLITGTTIAQALPIALAPILTRVFSPEEFGLLALYSAIVVILSVIATGRYELAIVLPKDREEAYQILVLSCEIATVVALVILVVIVGLKEYIIQALGNPQIEVWLYWIPFSVFLMAVYQSLYYWYNREKNFKNMAGSRIVQSSTMLTFQIIAGLNFKLSSLGLIFGQIVGQIFSIIFMLFRFFCDVKESRNSSLKKQYRMAIRYIKFPKFFMAAHVMDASSRQLPSVFLNVLISSTVAGYFLLIQRVVGAPVSILSGAIGDVFRQQASHAFASRGDCAAEFKSTFKKLLLIAVLPFSIFYLIAPTLFLYAFGEEWLMAGEYARILTPMFFFQFIASPMANMYIIAEKQEQELILQIIMLISIMGIFLSGNEVYDLLVMYSTFYSSVYAFVLVSCFNFSKGNS